MAQKNGTKKWHRFIWHCDCVISINTELNSPALLNTFKHQTYTSSLYRSDFSSKLQLGIKPHVGNAEQRTYLKESRI